MEYHWASVPPLIYLSACAYARHAIAKALEPVQGMDHLHEMVANVALDAIEDIRDDIKRDVPAPITTRAKWPISRGNPWHRPSLETRRRIEQIMYHSPFQCIRPTHLHTEEDGPPTTYGDDGSTEVDYLLSTEPWYAGVYDLFRDNGVPMPEQLQELLPPNDLKCYPDSPPANVLSAVRRYLHEFEAAVGRRYAVDVILGCHPWWSSIYELDAEVPLPAYLLCLMPPNYTPYD